MITTHVHTVSSTATAFTTAGMDVFESGPTNFVLSFSGANASGTYLQFYVKYPNDDNIYTISSPTDDVDDIRTQSISKTLYPDHDKHLTTYTIDVSGLKNDLTTNVYKINLNIGREVISKYGKLRVVGSHLYTSDQGSNYCLLTLEGQEPRFISNVIVPFTKDATVYVPSKPLPFIPDDNRVLRTELLTPIGGQVPICIEFTFNEIVEEDQWQQVAIFSENTYHNADWLLYHSNKGIPSRTIDGAGHTAGETTRGDTVNDYLIYGVEDGIDYSHLKEQLGGGPFENDNIINVTIIDIYPDGIAS